MRYTLRTLTAFTSVFLLIGAGCASATQVTTESSPTPTQQAAPQGEIVVATYNPTGLDKKEFNINKGDSIEFRNSDLKPHWPASNPHPTHTDYPEFDPKTVIKPGDVWRFTFMKAGDWKFHDHLNGRSAVVSGVVHVK